MTAWTDFVKDFANTHKISYKEALKNPECKIGYKKDKSARRKKTKGLPNKIVTKEGAVGATSDPTTLFTTTPIKTTPVGAEGNDADAEKRAKLQQSRMKLLEQKKKLDEAKEKKETQMMGEEDKPKKRGRPRKNPETPAAPKKPRGRPPARISPEKLAEDEKKREVRREKKENKMMAAEDKPKKRGRPPKTPVKTGKGESGGMKNIFNKIIGRKTEPNLTPAERQRAEQVATEMASADERGISFGDVGLSKEEKKQIAEAHTKLQQAKQKVKKYTDAADAFEAEINEQLAKQQNPTRYAAKKTAARLKGFGQCHSSTRVTPSHPPSIPATPASIDVNANPLDVNLDADLVNLYIDRIQQVDNHLSDALRRTPRPFATIRNLQNTKRRMINDLHSMGFVYTGQGRSGGDWENDVERATSLMGKPFEPIIGVNPADIGYQIGRNVIGRAIFGAGKKRKDAPPSEATPVNDIDETIPFTGTEEQPAAAAQMEYERPPDTGELFDSMRMAGFDEEEIVVVNLLITQIEALRVELNRVRRELAFNRIQMSPEQIARMEDQLEELGNHQALLINTLADDYGFEWVGNGFRRRMRPRRKGRRVRKGGDWENDVERATSLMGRPVENITGINPATIGYKLGRELGRSIFGAGRSGVPATTNASFSRGALTQYPAKISRSFSRSGIPLSGGQEGGFNFNDPDVLYTFIAAGGFLALSALYRWAYLQIIEGRALPDPVVQVLWDNDEPNGIPEAEAAVVENALATRMGETRQEGDIELTAQPVAPITRPNLPEMFPQYHPTHEDLELAEMGLFIPPASTHVLDGQGRGYPDWEHLKWGSFTKQFNAFKSQHPRSRVKDLDGFARMVLKSPKKFQPTTLKRARFYLNVIEKKGKKDPCWKGYEEIGMKMKNGKKVPNCVPKKGGMINPFSDPNYKPKEEMEGGNLFQLPLDTFREVITGIGTSDFQSLFNLQNVVNGLVGLRPELAPYLNVLNEVIQTFATTPTQTPAKGDMGNPNKRPDRRDDDEEQPPRMPRLLFGNGRKGGVELHGYNKGKYPDLIGGKKRGGKITRKSVLENYDKIVNHLVTHITDPKEPADPRDFKQAVEVINEIKKIKMGKGKKGGVELYAYNKGRYPDI